MKKIILYGVVLVVCTTFIVYAVFIFIKEKPLYLEGFAIEENDLSNEIRNSYNEKIKLLEVKYSYKGKDYLSDKRYILLDQLRTENEINISHHLFLLIDNNLLKEELLSLDIDNIDVERLSNKISFDIRNDFVYVNLDNYLINDNVKLLKSIEIESIDNDFIPTEVFIPINKRFSFLDSFSQVLLTRELSKLAKAVNELSLELDSTGYIYTSKNITPFSTLVSRSNNIDFSFYSNEEAYLEITKLQDKLKFDLYVINRKENLDIKPNIKEKNGVYIVCKDYYINNNLEESYIAYRQHDK